MDDPRKARGKLARVQRDVEEDVTSRLWSEEGCEMEVEGKWSEMMGEGKRRG